MHLYKGKRLKELCIVTFDQVEVKHRPSLKFFRKTCDVIMSGGQVVVTWYYRPRRSDIIENMLRPLGACFRVLDMRMIQEREMSR